LATLFAVQQIPGQQADSASAPPTGVIVGQTVDGTTGASVSGAVVSISHAPPASGVVVAAASAGPNTGPTRVISDGTGRFVFHDLAAGSYTLTASKPGYADAAFGRRTPGAGSQSLILADGQRRGDVTLGLWKHGTISGTVVDEAGEPIIGLQLRVLKRAIVGGSVRFTSFGNMPSTDDRGIYRSSGLAPGDYVVGIVTTQTTVPASLQDAFAAASKAGTSQDLQRELDRSRSSLNSSGLMPSGQRVGDLLLQTALGSGSSGAVMTPPADGSKVYVYPAVFYPEATAPSKATIVTVGPGDEKSNINFQIKPVVTLRVSGAVTGPDGPEAHTTLDLLPASADEVQRDYDFAAASTTTDANGAFTFLGVTPGNYTIRSLKIPAPPVTQSTMGTVIQTGTSVIMSGGGPSIPPPIPKEPTYWANMPVAIGESDVTGVAVTFHAGARLTGHLEFEGAAQKPPVDRLRQASVLFDPADGRTTSWNQFTLGRGVIDASGQFNSYQLPAGRYVVRGPAFATWTFKGAFVNGHDVTDTPLDLGADDIGDIVVTYTDQPTELSGTARGDQTPDGTATVLMFPAQQNMWTAYGSSPRRFRPLRAGTDGVYRITGLPAGDYLVIAIRTDIPADWQDVKFLQKIAPLSTRVSIADGEKKTQDLQTREIR
jgi:hypothetical protein